MTSHITLPYIGSRLLEIQDQEFDLAIGGLVVEWGCDGCEGAKVRISNGKALVLLVWAVALLSMMSWLRISLGDEQSDAMGFSSIKYCFPTTPGQHQSNSFPPSSQLANRASEQCTIDFFMATENGISLSR